MKSIIQASVVISLFAITGCSSGTQAVSEPRPQPQIVYEGDSPEAAKWKAYGTCMAAAIEAGSQAAEFSCVRRFGTS